jgi:hypothetical protein
MARREYGGVQHRQRRQHDSEEDRLAFELLKAEREDFPGKSFAIRCIYVSSLTIIILVAVPFAERFQPWSNRAMWCRGLDITQHVDAIMHLIFEGVIKTTIQLIHAWIKGYGANPCSESSCAN